MVQQLRNREEKRVGPQLLAHGLLLGGRHEGQAGLLRAEVASLQKKGMAELTCANPDLGCSSVLSGKDHSSISIPFYPQTLYE